MICIEACRRAEAKKVNMRRFSHLTPRYVIDRTWVMYWQRRYPGAPWLTARAVDILSEWLRPDDTVFEWGSGNSTVWFSERVARVVSVEHDNAWYTKVGMALQSRAQARVERHLVETREGDDDPSAGRYVDMVATTPDDSIDTILVDGIHRDRCAIRSLAKIRPGGLLVLDNADWYIRTGSRTPGSKRTHEQRTPTWARFDSAVSSWRRIVTTNGVWDTVLWVKPA